MPWLLVTLQKVSRHQDQVISSATTARLEEIDLGILHWEGINQDEIKAFGGMDIFTTPSWPAAGAVGCFEAFTRALST
jgi:hypothetical protein